VVAVATAALALTGGAASAQLAEQIDSYDVAIVVEPTGALHIAETIDYDFGGNQRHGIFRDIPVRLHFDKRYDRVYPLHVLSVTGSPGTPAQYKVEDAGGGTRRIRVGDANRTISGRHRYVITYRVDRVLNALSDRAELDWNGIGAKWQVPVREATVAVTAPAAIRRVTCFAGPKGSSLPCARAAADGSLARFSHGFLAPFQALTVVVGVPKGAVTVLPPELDERWSFARAFSVTPATVGGSAALLATAVTGLFWLAWRKGRDRRYVGSPVDVVYGSNRQQRVPLFERPTTPVELEPPGGLRPGQVGTLIDEAANPLDVTATVVDLASRGFLRIEAIPKHGWFGKPDWKLVHLQDGKDPRRYESLLLTELFEDGDEVTLSSLRNHFAPRLHKVEEALYSDAMAQGWFVRRPDRVRGLWTGIAVALIVVGGVVVGVTAAFTHLGLVPVPLVIGGLLLLALRRRMPSRTAKGTAALRCTLGFRRFIVEPEVERAKFAERKNLFSEYLAYAVVFGATEKWAKAFADLDTEELQPGWYVSTRPFTVAGFSHSLDGFAVATAGTIAATPAGSGSSGFGGGGSSGGGGGGGGGGSW